MDELLKKLSETDGVSGNENDIREIVKAEATKYADSVTVDNIGNVIAYKKGRTGKSKVMLCAHMDEVGLMVSYIEDNGFIKFKPVGGIDQRVLLAKRVRIGKSKLTGVIGVKAVHLQSQAERNSVIPLSSMYIDVGAASKDETGVKLGDYISFDTKFDDFGDGKIKGKALDDRLGVAALLSILRNTYDDDIYACFTVQEEIGLRGAGPAAYVIKPDIAIVCEATTAADVPDVKEAECVTVLGAGPALSYADSATIGDKRLINDILNTARAEGIAYQIKRSAAGGNDAGAIHISRDGIPTAVISVPCRYIHSPVSVADSSDHEGMIALLDAYLKSRSNN